MMCASSLAVPCALSQQPPTLPAKKIQLTKIEVQAVTFVETQDNLAYRICDLRIRRQVRGVPYHYWTRQLSRNLGWKKANHAPGDELHSSNGPNAVRIRARYVGRDDIAAR